MQLIKLLNLVGAKIIIWNGPKTTKIKKAKALEVAIKLNNENNAGKGKIINTDDNETQNSKAECKSEIN